MTEEEFWQLIETAAAGRTRYDDDGEAIADALTNLLAMHDLAALLDYKEHFDRLHDALYQWKYWAAGYIINGGCSDDAFIDFRAGVISLGRDWYERFKADPDCLAGHEEVRALAARGEDGALFAEMVNYVAADAYEQKTGEREEFYGHVEQRRKQRGEPDREPEMGERFDFEDGDEMHRRLPRLAALYNWYND